MIDLVEQLRWGSWYYEDPFDGVAYADDSPLDAAARIEQLEAALREIVQSGDKDGDQWWRQWAVERARVALGDKQ